MKIKNVARSFKLLNINLPLKNIYAINLSTKSAHMDPVFPYYDPNIIPKIFTRKARNQYSVKYPTHYNIQI
jgi:hypothetical protein